MKAFWRVFGAVGVAFLASACGFIGGGGGVLITVKQLDTEPVTVTYRVGTGSWQALSLSGGQGTFTATAPYEVAVRCPNAVQLYKAAPSYRDQVVFACSVVRSPTVERAFEVSLPDSIGSEPVQSGDYVLIGSQDRVYDGTNPVIVNSVDLQQGKGKVLVVVARPLLTPTQLSLKPLGYKVVEVDTAIPDNVIVDNSNWQAFSEEKTVSASLPPGYRGLSFTLFVKDGYLVYTPLSGLESSEGTASYQYGVLPLTFGGVYLSTFWAIDLAKNMLMAYKDTGRANWQVSWPDPWASGQFVINGAVLSFNRSDARLFVANLEGFIQDAQAGTPLNLTVAVQASSGPTLYEVPEPPGLNYVLVGNPSGALEVEALTRDQGAELIGLTETPAETQAKGVDVSLAARFGTYTGPTFTLP